MRPSTSTSRRTATAVATIGLASLVSLAPAQARTDPGPPVPSAGTPADSSRFDNDHGGAGTPAPPPERIYEGSIIQQNLWDRQKATAPAAPGPTTMLRVDDDAVEYLQIGLGALAGVALFGAAAAAVSASHRRHAAHPA